MESRSRSHHSPTRQQLTDDIKREKSYSAAPADAESQGNAVRRRRVGSDASHGTHSIPPVSTSSNYRRRAVNSDRQSPHSSFVEAETEKHQRQSQHSKSSRNEDNTDSVSNPGTVASKKSKKYLDTVPSSVPGSNGSNVRRTPASPSTSKKAPLVMSTKPSNSLSKLSKKASNLSLLKQKQSTPHLLSMKRQKSMRLRESTLLSKILQYCGIYYHDVILTDPGAIEAVKALELTQSHLRKLKVKFNNIDIDGSGSIGKILLLLILYIIIFMTIIINFIFSDSIIICNFVCIITIIIIIILIVVVAV